MRKRVFAFVAAFVLASASLQSGAQQAQTPSRSASGYLMPPKVIVDILDAPPTPGVMLTPDRRAVAGARPRASRPT